MEQVKVLKTIKYQGEYYNPGDIIEIEKDDVKEIIGGGLAEKTQKETKKKGKGK